MHTTTFFNLHSALLYETYSIYPLEGDNIECMSSRRMLALEYGALNNLFLVECRWYLQSVENEYKTISSIVYTLSGVPLVYCRVLGMSGNYFFNSRIIHCLPIST